MLGFLLLLAQGLLYFAVLAGLFYKRKTLGLGVFISVLGALHFLTTYLAATVRVELPFGLISNGSVVLFTGEIAMLLLLYIKEDADSMRQPVYGLVIGNLLIAALVLIMRPYGQFSHGGQAIDFDFLGQMGLLMLWSTALFFVELIAMVLIYERMNLFLTRTVPGRIFFSLAIVLSFDQLGFYAGLHWLTQAPPEVFFGGWVAKMGAVVFFTLMLELYLHFVEKHPVTGARHATADVFDRLTYRYRYEKLASQIGRDSLTGLLDRGQFDARGPDTLETAARADAPMSLMMIDIDYFKEINDRHGHPAGDRVLREVVEAITRVKRESDQLFRYGGDEFALICYPMPAQNGLLEALARRILSSVANMPDPGLGQPVTLSIGIARFPANARDFPDLVNRADQALYRAKELGRNRAEMLD